MRRQLLAVATLITTSMLVALWVSVPTASAQHFAECPDPDVAVVSHFVWGIDADDPDGGLVQRIGPGEHRKQIGVPASDHARVSPTGACWVGADGAIWFQTWNYPGSSKAWVNSTFLRPAEHACLMKTQRSDTGLILPAGGGNAIIDGDTVAFQPYWDNHYHFVDSSTVVTNVLCETQHNHEAPGPVSIHRPPPGGAPLVICG